MFCYDFDVEWKTWSVEERRSAPAATRTTYVSSKFAIYIKRKTKQIKCIGTRIISLHFATSARGMWMWIECKAHLQLARIDFEMSSERVHMGRSGHHACVRVLYRVYINLLLHSCESALPNKCHYTVASGNKRKFDRRHMSRNRSTIKPSKVIRHNESNGRTFSTSKITKWERRPQIVLRFRLPTMS